MAKQLALIIFSSFLLSCSKNIYNQNERFINFKNTGRHININLKVSQYGEGNFYFDTGSPWMIIDSTFYKNQQMSFNYYSKQEITGVGDNRRNMIKVLDTIKISANNNTFSSKFNLIHNLKPFLGKNIDGIVGFANFGNMPFKIDYISQKIILNPQVNNSYQEVAIKFDGNFMYIPMEFMLSHGTTIRGEFLVDTGSKETALTSEFESNKYILNGKKATYRKNELGGLDTGHSLFVANVKIDKFKLTDQQIDVSDDRIGPLSKNEKYIGIIGNDMLDNFDIIYHPARYKIWIRPNKNFNNTSEELYKPFILIETNDKDKSWRVGGIYEESDVYKKGLRNRDEFIEVNNISVKKLNIDKFDQKLKPNQKLKLKVKRGNDYIEIETYLNVFLKKND